MVFNWFKIFNLNEFLSTGLVSRTYLLDLEGIGEQEILVTRGEMVSMTYQGVMLFVNYEDESLFIFDGHASFLDDNTGDVYLGVPIES